MTDENFLRQYIIHGLLEFEFGGVLLGGLLFSKKNNETLKDCINKQSTIDILTKIKKFELNESHKWKIGSQVHELFIRVNEWLFRIRTANEIVNIQDNLKKYADNVQNTADVVNLFTDIDKNRTSLEEQIKKVNNRLEEQDIMINNRMDKLEELDNRVNNRLNKLEASMELIISMLQKN